MSTSGWQRRIIDHTLLTAGELMMPPMMMMMAMLAWPHVLLHAATQNDLMRRELWERISDWGLRLCCLPTRKSFKQSSMN